MGQIYHEVVDLIKRNNLQGKVEIKFIDLLFDDLTGYESIGRIAKMGIKPPIITINGRVTLYSAPTPEAIFKDIKKAL